MLFIKHYSPTVVRLLPALSADYKTFISPFLLPTNAPHAPNILLTSRLTAVSEHPWQEIFGPKQGCCRFLFVHLSSRCSVCFACFQRLTKQVSLFDKPPNSPLLYRFFYVFSIQVIEELGGKNVLSISETMLFLYRLPRKFLIISSILCTLIIAFLVWKTTRPKYVCTNGMGPVVVDSWLDRGYKVIGRYKLLNPRPLPLTESDWLFIHKQLPAWVRNHYPNYRHTPTISQLPIDSLKSNTSYQFTLLQDGKLLEEDVYLLSLPSPNVDQPLKIYIPKASVADEKQLTKDGRLVSKPVLVYPFLTEAWERNINETKPYCIGDMW